MSTGQGLQAIGAGLQGAASRMEGLGQRQLKSMQATQATQATLAMQEGFSQIEAEFEAELQKQLSGEVGGDRSRFGAENILDEEVRAQWMNDRLDDVVNRAIEENITTPRGKADFTNHAAQVRADYEKLWADKEQAALREYERHVTPRILNDLIETHVDNPSVGVVSATDLLQSMVEDGVWSVSQANEFLNDFKRSSFANAAQSFIKDPVDENNEPIDNFNDAHAAAKERIDQLANDPFLQASGADRDELHRMNDQMKEQRINEQRVQTSEAAVHHVSHNVHSWMTQGLRTQDAMREIDIHLSKQEEYTMLPEDHRERVRNAAYIHMTRMLPPPGSGSGPGGGFTLSDEIQIISDEFWRIADLDRDGAERVMRESFLEGPGWDQLVEAHGARGAERIRQYFDSSDPKNPGVFHQSREMMHHPLGGQVDSPAFDAMHQWMEDNGIPRNSPMAMREYRHLAEYVGFTAEGTSHMTEVKSSDVEAFMRSRNSSLIEHVLDELDTTRFFGLFGGTAVEQMAEGGFEADVAATVYSSFAELALDGTGENPLKQTLSTLIQDVGSMMSVDGAIDIQNVERAIMRDLGLDDQMGVDSIENDFTRRHAQSMRATVAATQELINATGGAFVGHNEQYDSYQIKNIHMDAETGNLIAVFDLDGSHPMRNQRLMIDTRDPNNPIAYPVVTTNRNGYPQELRLNGIPLNGMPNRPQTQARREAQETTRRVEENPIGFNYTGM